MPQKSAYGFTKKLRLDLTPSKNEEIIKQMNNSAKFARLNNDLSRFYEI